MKHKRWAFDLLLCCCLSLCGLAHASTVPLAQSVDLPIVVEGKTVGSMKLPAGSEVEIVSNDGTNAVIKRGGATYTIAADSLPSASSSPQPTPIAKAPEAATPIIPSKPLDKTLNESTMAHFFIPCGEHSPSIIDSSRLNDEMPGKNGWLTVKDGHLYTGSKRLRIAGVNMVSEMKRTGYEFSNDDILEMRKFGFNGVRLWSNHSMYNRKTHSLNPDGWKNFDKLVAKLIESGMWIDLNLITDACPDEVDPNIAALDKKFIKDFFTHVNPYTGRAYAQEPALFCVELSNEDGFYGENYLHSNLDKKYFTSFETYKDQLHSRWNEWLRKKYADQAALDQAWPNNKESLGGIASLTRENWSQFPAEKEQDWRRFLVSLEVKWYKSTIDYIHKEIGYRGLVSTSAEISVPPVIANLGDIVRNQGYFRDPTRPEAQRRPEGIGIDQSFDTSAVWRVVGKPFMHTEHNIYAPSPYSGETALYALTAATVQDWDAVFLFFWDDPWSWKEEHNPECEGAGNKDTGRVINSPTLLASLPTAINLYRRGDLKPPASNKFEQFNSEDLLTNGTTKMVHASGDLCDLFHTRMGTAFSPMNSSEELFGEGGTFHADRDYNIEVDTPKTILTITSDIAHMKIIGGCTLEVGKTLLGWVCFGVTSLNNDIPIKDAKNLLVTLIGSSGDPRKLVPGQKEWPKGPCMAECISANVFIPVDTSKGTFIAYALDEKAQRKGEIPLEVTADGITLHTTGKEGTVWYEIARK